MESMSFSMIVHIKGYTFQFDNKIYSHDKGAAIGVSIAGEVAKIIMVWRERMRKGRRTLNSIHINMYSGYVDDIPT